MKANKQQKGKFEKRYVIDCESGSGSGCDKLFTTRKEAEFHMSLWTEEERKGCFIAEVRYDCETGEYQYW